MFSNNERRKLKIDCKKTVLNYRRKISSKHDGINYFNQFYQNTTVHILVQFQPPNFNKFFEPYFFFPFNFAKKIFLKYLIFSEFHFSLLFCQQTSKWATTFFPCEKKPEIYTLIIIRWHEKSHKFRPYHYLLLSAKSEHFTRQRNWSIV